MDAASPNELRYEGVFVDADEVAEERRGRRVVAVPRGAIRRIEVARGARGERVVAQAAFAVLLLVLGVLAAAILLGELRTRDATIHLNMAGGLGFVPLGAWVLWSALRPAYFLRVRTDRDMRKIVFEPNAQVEQIAAFLERVRRVHGYEVEWRVERSPATTSRFR